MRVHTDAAALEATAESGALAFAAGRDVYFAPGAFAPDMPSGVALIAHEVAHVLQQTGRTDRRGVVHATAQEGAGALQLMVGARFPKAAPRVTLDERDPDNVHLNQLIDAYEVHFKKDAGLVRAIDWLVDKLSALDGGVYERDAQLKSLDELVAQIKAGVDGGQGPARSFVVEVLAMTDGGPNKEYWKAAATVLWRDEEHDHVARLASVTEPFMIWLRENRNDDYFARSLSHPRLQPWFDDLFPNYLDLIVNLQAKPGRDLQGVDGTTGAKLTFTEQVNTLKLEMMLGPTLSFRDFLAAVLLGQMNEERRGAIVAWGRQAKIETDQSRAAGKVVTGFDLRLVAARLMKEHFEPSKWGARAKVWQELAQKLHQLASNVEDIWTRALEPYRAMQKSMRLSELIATDAASKMGASLVRTAELDSLEKTLDGHATALFDKPGEAPPAPGDFNAKVTALKTDLSALFEATNKTLVGTLQATPDASISTTQAWVLVWLNEAIVGLDKAPYDLASDLKDQAVVQLAPDKWGPGQAEDLRRYHRHVLAVLFLRTGLVTGMSQVTKLARAMVIGDSQTRLLVTQDWKPTEDPPGKMLADFPGGASKFPIKWVSETEANAAAAANPKREAVAVDAPFTMNQLVEFFSLSYLQTVNTEVEKVLADAYQKPIDKDTTVSLTSVREATKSRARPRKWVPGKHVILINPNDPRNRDYTVGSLISLSGKTAQQVKRERMGAQILPRMGLMAEAPVFIWSVPDLSPMVQYLRTNVPLLDAMIAASTGKPAPTNVDDWIYELGKIGQANHPDRLKIWEAIRAAFKSSLHGIPREQKILLQRSRELSALQRQIIKVRAAYLLKAWKNRSRGGMAGEVAYYKEEALQEVRNYRVGVEPWTDAETQSAALWLDLGPTLDDAFPDGEEIPPDIMPHLVRSIDAAKQEQAGRPTVSNPLEAPVMIADIIGRGGESVASIVAGQAALESVLRKLIKYLESQQAKTGFYAEDNRLKTWRYQSSFGVKGEFSWDNRNYRIKAIHRSFAYHPPIGGVPSKLKESNAKGAKDIPRDAAVPLFTIDIDDESAPLGSPTPRTWALAGPSAEGIPEERAKRRTLPKLTGKETTEDLEERSLLEEKYKSDEQTEKETGRYLVTSADDKLLNVIGFAVELAAMNEDLQQTGEALGNFMDAVVTALEMILPGGQVILLAELIAGAVQTVTDPAMIELLDNVRQDPELIIKLLWDKIKKLMSFEGLWEVLFDDGMEGLAGFSGFANIADEVRGSRKNIGKVGKSSSTRRAKPRGRLGRVVQYIVGLGKRFLRALRLFKLKFKGPLNRIRSTIVTRPKLAWVLVKAVSLLSQVGRALDPDSLKDLGAGSMGEVADDAKSHFIDFAKFFSEMHLPGELVPLNELYGWVVGFIIGKIPKVKLIKPLLDAFGWTQKIAGALIEWIGVKDSWADPNHWWKEMLLPKLELHFTEIKREFVHSMLGLVNDVGQLLPTKFKIDLPSDGEIGHGGPTLVSDEELQELESSEPALNAAVSLPQDGGHSLDSGARSAAESHFGQDFGHVRVHDDASSLAFTTAIGAEAATSGSHVYLGPNATSSSDSNILHHELGHVVQQTGSRPLGGAHSDAPVRGASGRGIHHDAGLEAAADQMATAGGASATPSAGAAELGVQPKFSDGLLKKAVDSLTRFTPGGTQFKAHATAETPGEDRAKQIWKALVEMLPKDATFEKFISDPKVRSDIIDRIAKPITNKDIVSVAAMAQRKVGGQTTPTGEDVTTLNPAFFMTLLEGFIFARTGVAMQITAHHDAGSTQLKKVKVYYVHLPLVSYASDAGKKLWDRVMQTKGLVTPADGKNGATKIRHLLKGELGAKRPEPFIWDHTSTSFQLSALFVQEFRTLLEQSRDKRPTKVEKAKDYAETELSKNSALSGLRVATHGELTKGTPPERADRDSHHVPQFLLVEFLRNRNENEKAWPTPAGSNAADTAYGTALRMGKSSTFLVDSVSPGGKTFNLKALDATSDRGVGLPAVLLARRTHQRGELHLDDHADEHGDKLGQSGKIKKKWNKELPSELRTNDVNEWNKHITKAGVAVKVASAMQETYRWLYKEVMMPGLKDALRDIEKPYYEGLAAELGHVDKNDNLLMAYELTTSMINNVVKKVEDKNRSIMTGW